MRRLFATLALAAALAACGQQSSVMEEIDKQNKAEADAAGAVIAEGQKFLAENKAKAGVTTTKSGLQYEVVRKGDEKLAPPSPQDTVNVMYEGKLVNGTVFDSAYERGAPIQFEVGGVIPGWTEALQLMHPGAEFQLVLPPEIGYGEDGSPPTIPGHSVLIFKVELLGYKTPAGKIVGKF